MSRLRVGKSRKLTDFQVLNIKRQIAQGCTDVHLASIYNVSVTTIRRIRTGRTYRDIQEQPNDESKAVV